MKITRAKRAHKTLSFYSNNFGFRQPYQVLIDGTMCFFALKNKINLQEQLPKYFASEVKLLTTQCVIIETEKLGPSLYGAMLIAKQFPLHRCGHEGNPQSGSTCLLSMIGKINKNRYIVGTQDRDLQEKLRLVPGAPILYIHQKAPTLEAPSAASLKRSDKVSQAKFLPEKQSGENVDEIKRRIFGASKEEEKPVFRKKKIKGPNPLSCKKKKKQNSSVKNLPVIEGKVKKNRTRKRVKVASHIKEHIKSKVGDS
ncbi:rRNA-processing protein UTP23 homolog [Neocloeon triangulifer]|uniref:rRNA-processing protein UTP23 homolog n=1 Tax=Neocloeon triangulifer TaxID=2078957 RepID=UPI00286EDC22|nr:rRNA-processing protein UTP23 homolog [Neocloeon triangulifer]